MNHPVPRVFWTVSLLRLVTSRGFEGEKQHVIVRTMIESAAVSLNDPQQSKSWWRATDVPPTIGVYSGRFSPTVTLLSALFLTVALGSVVGLSASASKVDRIESPEQALSLMVSRTMDVQEGLKRAPQWDSSSLPGPPAATRLNWRTRLNGIKNWRRPLKTRWCPFSWRFSKPRPAMSRRRSSPRMSGPEQKTRFLSLPIW